MHTYSCRSGLPEGEAEGVNLARGQRLEHRGRKGALGPGGTGAGGASGLGHAPVPPVASASGEWQEVCSVRVVKDWAFLSAVPLHSAGASAPPRLAEPCQEMQCGGEGEGELAAHVHGAHVGSQARYKQPTLRMNFQPFPPWKPLFLLQESPLRE